MAGETFLTSLKRDRESRKGPSVYASDKVFSLVDDIDGQHRRIDDLLEANNRYQQEARDARNFLRQLCPAGAPPAVVMYTNHRGEIAERRITPLHIRFGATEWHPKPQWLLKAFDHDKQADRDFALIDFGRAIGGGDYFSWLVNKARDAAAKASAKFPQPNYVTLKIAEEAGEVVRGAVHYAEGRMKWSEVEGEIVQLLAMLIRLLTEGDQVNGIYPPTVAPRSETIPAKGEDELVKPCDLADPSRHDCPNMKEVGGGFEGERYRCAVCGKGYFLDYEEMK